MAQSYKQIKNTDVISDSINDVINNFDTLKTTFSGIAFPTAELAIGMQCYRTDLKKKFILESITPLVWKETAINMLTRNKAYVFGDVVKSGNLKSYEYLKCVTAGTTAGTEPSLADMYIQDGTVKWLKSTEPLATYVRPIDNTSTKLYKIASIYNQNESVHSTYLSFTIKLQDNNRNTSRIQVDIGANGTISQYYTGDTYKQWGSPTAKIQIATYKQGTITDVYMRVRGKQAIYEIEYNWHSGNTRDSKEDGFKELPSDYVPEGTLFADTDTGQNCVGSMSIDGNIVVTNKYKTIASPGTNESKFYPIYITPTYKDIFIYRHVHQQASGKGACSLLINGRGSGWGGDAQYTKYTYSWTGNEISKNPIGRILLASKDSGIIIWLRGGFNFSCYGDSLGILPLTKVNEDTYTSVNGDIYTTIAAPDRTSGLEKGTYYNYYKLATETYVKNSLVTDGALNLRKKSTAYAIGDIAYDRNLPSWARLECVVAGTTSNADLPVSRIAGGGILS